MWLRNFGLVSVSSHLQHVCHVSIWRSRAQGPSGMHVTRAYYAFDVKAFFFERSIHTYKRHKSRKMADGPTYHCAPFLCWSIGCKFPHISHRHQWRWKFSATQNTWQYVDENIAPAAFYVISFPDQVHLSTIWSSVYSVYMVPLCKCFWKIGVVWHIFDSFFCKFCYH